MSKPVRNAWKWEPGSGNAPAGFHFESYIGHTYVVRDGMTIMGACASGPHKGRLILLDSDGLASPAREL